MKKWILAASISLLIFSSACSSSSSSSSGGIFGSTSVSLKPQSWVFSLTSVPGLSKYFVTVSNGGGSGTAVISVSVEAGGATTALGNFQVFDGVAIPVSPPSGPSIQMSSTAGNFNLVKGDQWVFMFDTDQLVGILPTKPDTSAVKLAVAAAPVSPKCQFGLFDGLPRVTLTMGSVTEALSSSPLIVDSGGGMAEANMGETSLLLFQTLYPTFSGSSIVVMPGDSVEVSYKRNLVFDSGTGDIFEVYAINDNDMQLLDMVQKNSAATTTITKKFIAKGTFVGLEFVFSLDSTADAIRLDDFSVKVNGSVVFSDDFEGQALALGIPNFAWTPAKPPTMLGSAGICSTNPISGVQSWCVSGGRPWSLFGEGASVGGTNALEFTLADGSIGSSFWLGSFLGVDSDNVLAGTYLGKNYDQSCTEQGAFVSLINPKETALMGGTWDISVQGQLKNCDNPADEGSPVAFTVSSVPMVQLSTLFGGALSPSPLAPPLADSLGDGVSLAGFVQSNSLEGMLSTTLPASVFYRLSLQGIAGGSAASGQVTGWAAKNPMMLFSTCDFQGVFSLTVTH